MTTLKPGGLRIARQDRAVFVGTTGSGKTALAKSLLLGQNRVLILDPKRTLTLPADRPHIIVTEMSDVKAADLTVPVIYRPSIDVLDDMANAFFFHAFELGDVLVYVDEVMRVTGPKSIGKGYATCIQMGREKGVGIWHATQRPANIPLVILTESEHFFVFQLRHIEDRRRMADYSHPEVLTRNPREYEFWYYNDRQQRLKFYKRADIGPFGGNNG